MEILLPRMARICGSLSNRRSLPSNSMLPLSILPGGIWIRRITASEETLLPEPDSPTIPSVFPASTENERPFTARTMPSSVRNVTSRFFTESSGMVLEHRSYENGGRVQARPCTAFFHAAHGVFLCSTAARLGVESIAETFAHEVE